MCCINMCINICAMLIFRIGASIYVDLDTSPVPYSNLVRNQQCFIIHSDLNLSPNDWKNVKLLVVSTNPPNGFCYICIGKHQFF